MNAGNGNLQIFLKALAPTQSGFDLCMSTSNCISMHRISCSPGHKSYQNFLHLDRETSTCLVLWFSYCHTKRPFADRCVAEYVVRVQTWFKLLVGWDFFGWNFNNYVDKMRWVRDSDESEPSWLKPELELKDFQLGLARLVTFLSSARNRKSAETSRNFYSFQIFSIYFFILVAKS